MGCRNGCTNKQTEILNIKSPQTTKSKYKIKLVNINVPLSLVVSKMVRDLKSSEVENVNNIER